MQFSLALGDGNQEFLPSQLFTKRLFLQTVDGQVTVVPGVGTCWQLKHQEKHLSDDTLRTYLPQIPAVLF